MGMIRFCAVPGCNTKTLGKICFEHERSFGLGPFRSQAHTPWVGRTEARSSSPTATGS